MKKSISVLLAGILMISLTACGERSSKRYKPIESYTATALVTVTGNKGATVYEMKQSYRAPDSYRLEVVKPERLSGTVTVMVGQELWMKNGNTPAVPVELAGLEEGADFLFPVRFLNEYFAKVPQPTLQEENGTLLLTAPVPEGNQYRFHQNVLLDAKSFLPTALITYDEDGGEVLRVEFRDFQRDAELNDSVFSL